MIRSTQKLLLLALVFCALPVPCWSQSSSNSLRGSVADAHGTPLSGVHIILDELGVSRDTDAKGSFRITLPPEALQRGFVRLSFDLQDYQTHSLEIKLPAAAALAVVMNPLFSRGAFPPTMPSGLLFKLRQYRQKEIAQLHAFLGGREKKLLVLEGMPGVGSVELALTALHDLPKTSRQPVLWWNCRETDGFGDLAEEWSRAFQDRNLGNMGRQRSRLQDEAEQQALSRAAVYKVMANLRRSPYIIVLNDFENWLAAASHAVEDQLLADFVAALLTHEHAGKILLLAQERPVFPKSVNLAWVSFMPVAGFAEAHAVDYLASYLRLRVDRKLLAEVAAHFAGHPLALQLLHNRLQDLAVGEQEDQIRQLLQTRERPLDAAELENLFQQAYSRLSAAEKTVLHTLALVRQPLTTGQLEEIGFADSLRLTSVELRQTCERLAERRHLLQRRQNQYDASQLVRQYVDQLLWQRKPHKAGVHRLALRWYRQQFPPENIDRMANNPKAATIAGYDELVYHAFALAELDTGQSSASAARLATATGLRLRNWHTLRDANRLMFSQFERGRRLMLKQNSKEATQLYVNCLKELGDLYVRTDQLAAADSIYQQALPRFRQIESRWGEATTLQALGDLYMRTDQLAAADSIYQQALPLYRQIESRLGEATTLKALGDLYVRTDQLAAADSIYQQALPLYRQIESRLGEANTLRALGDLYVRTDQLAAADSIYQQALPLYRQIESRLGEANTLQALGDLYVRTDQLAAADSIYQQALPLYRQIEDRLGEANTLQALGDLYVRTDQLAAADSIYQQALPLFRQIESRLGEANTLQALGDLYVRTARLAVADSIYQQALPLYRQIEDRLGEANTLRSIGDWHHAKGQPEQALAQYHRANELYLRIDEKIGQINCAMQLSDVYYALRQHEPAIRHIVTALSLGLKIDVPQINIIFRRLANLRQGMRATFFDSTAFAACAALSPEQQAQARAALQLLFARLDAEASSPIKQAEKLLENGEHEKAAALLQEIVREDSSNAPAWHLLARALSAQKMYAESIGAYERANRLAPDNASVLGSMGWTYYLMGEYRPSIIKSRAALGIDAQASWARCNLALALLHLGKTDSAAAEYRIAMSQIKTAEELERQAITDLEAALHKNPALRGGKEILQMLHERRALFNKKAKAGQ